MSEGLEESQAPLYDADAEQRIPFIVEADDDTEVTVVFVVGAQSNDLLEEYDRRRNLRLVEADKKETGGQAASGRKSDAFRASLWLFDQVVNSVEGFADSEEGDMPSTWKEAISDDDKVTVIDAAYLACEAVAPKPAAPGTRVPWNYKDRPKTVRMRALFSGYQVELAHVLKRASAEQLSEFRSIMSQGYLVQGAMIHKGETLIPPRARKLSILYDQLKESTTGYAGRVPLHHKVEAVLNHLSPSLRAVTKN
jgi:hypothetical protein